MGAQWLAVQVHEDDAKICLGHFSNVVYLQTARRFIKMALFEIDFDFEVFEQTEKPSVELSRRSNIA